MVEALRGQDALVGEEPKQEEPKPEEAKPVEPKPVEPKPEEPKPVEPKPEEPKPEEPKPEEPKPEEPKPEESQRWGYSDRDWNSPLEVFLTAPPQSELEKVLGFPLSPKELAQHLEEDRRREEQTGLASRSATSVLKAAAETAVAEPRMEESMVHDPDRPIKERFMEAAAFVHSRAAEKAMQAEEDVKKKAAHLERLREELARQEMALEEARINYDDMCEEKKCIEEISLSTEMELEDAAVAKGASEHLNIAVAMRLQKASEEANEKACKEACEEAHEKAHEEAREKALETPRKPHLVSKAIELSPESPGVETCIIQYSCLLHEALHKALCSFNFGSGPGSHRLQVPTHDLEAASGGSQRGCAVGGLYICHRVFCST